METVEQKAKLSAVVTELYESAGRETWPLFPKVLVRVLPRTQKVGGIYLPDEGKQNKPAWEGVVIRTYKPFYQKIYLSDARWVKDDPDPEARYVQKVECELKPGDHVMFPFMDYGITPVDLDGGKGEYRCVPEHLIMAKVEYERENVHKWLENLLLGAFEATEKIDRQDHRMIMAEYILKHADVVRRDLESVTISGK